MIKAILTDIEGTTTRITFVTEVLFPYARARIADYVAEHQQEPAVRREIDEVRKLIGDPDAPLEIVQSTLIQWIDEDRKATPLKALQGMIWETGYQDGTLKGHVYPDVVPQLETWKQAGLSLNVYSSGSVRAQKLLFGHSEQGDLTGFFDHYFDTNIGSKREPDSYRAISQVLGFSAAEILFLSDVVAELNAAARAGMRTCGLDRQLIGDGFGEHPFVHAFDQIDLKQLG